MMFELLPAACPANWDWSPPSGAPALADLLHNHADGLIECRFYIQISGIQQDGVGRPAHGRRVPAGIPFIPPQDIGQDGVVRDSLAPAEAVQMPPFCPYLGRSRNENLNV